MSTGPTSLSSAPSGCSPCHYRWTPPDGVDVVTTRARLLTEHGIVTTAIGPQRAPDEMTGPVLRVSPHLDATVDDLEALAAAL